MLYQRNLREVTYALLEELLRKRGVAHFLHVKNILR